MATYRNTGVCSKSVSFTLEDGRIHDVSFEGGCNGNTTGLGALLEGMPAKDAVGRLSGITCGRRPTSCPDQLAQALSAELEKDR